MSENRDIVVKAWPLEDIERELETILSEAATLPLAPTTGRISASAQAALLTLRKLLHSQ